MPHPTYRRHGAGRLEVLHKNLAIHAHLQRDAMFSGLRKTKEAWQFHITHAHNMARATGPGGRTKNWCNKYKNLFNEMKGDVGMSDQQK